MRRILLAAIIFLISGILFFQFGSDIASLSDRKVTMVYFSLLFIGCFLLVYFIVQQIIAKHDIAELNSEKDIIKNKYQENQSLFNNVFDNNNTGIAILNLDGRLVRVNQALCHLLGYGESDLLVMNFYYLIHPEDVNDLQIQIQNLLDQKVKVYQSEQHCYRKDGEKLWIMTTLSIIRDNEDKPICFIAQIQNITLQKKSEERLQHMAYHDPLTGLANRNKLEQFIMHILASSRRHQQSFALLFVDLDRFKNINDTLGHEAGDLVLQIISDRLRGIVRNTDMVSRLGGDEFVVLITDVKKSESIALIAQKILESTLEEIVVKEKEIYITTSIGISLFPHDGQNIQTLMKNADLALYRAKENGRNNYQFYRLEMTGRAQEKMALQNALGHALAKNEFVLNYQPKMEISTRKVTGIEALLRWKNHEYRAITPDQIIELAEETGLIIPVSEWVVKTALKQLKIWHDMGFTSLTLALNCTVRQFKQANFVDDILSVITQVGLSPQLIEIEITEGLIMQDPENTLRVLYALKDVGLQIAIDDFGTGYWSLSNLRKLAIDKIKIDKTFIKQVTNDETSASITKAIIAMVNKLGIKSVAEGVETRDQYEFLVREGCMEIQGYYLTQPLSGEAMTAFLKHPTPDAEVISRDEIITE